MKKKRVRKPYAKRGVTSYQPLTLCRCPKCEIFHQRKINWSGRGLPRIRCEDCERAVRYSDEYTEAEIFHDIPRGEEFKCIQ